MKSLSRICILLITTTASLVAAAKSTTTTASAWTSNPLLLQTIASAAGTDGYNIFSYGTQEHATDSFGFVLLPTTLTVISEANKDVTFADMIRNPEAMYFYIEHNTELRTEHIATTITTYSHTLAKRFMLLCAYKARRDHIQNELDYNAHIFKSINDVKEFLQKRLKDSSFVVFDVDTYRNKMFMQTIGGNKLKEDISSPREETIRHVAAGRSMSF